MLEKKSVENMKDDDEIEILLGEIPHATSSLYLQTTLTSGHTQHNNVLDHHGYYDHASCVIQKINGHGQGHGMYDDEYFKHVSSPVSGFSVKSHGSSSSLFSSSPSPSEELKSLNRFFMDIKKGNLSSLDDFHLYGDFSKMYISGDKSLDGAIGRNFENYAAFDNLSVPRELLNLDREVALLEMQLNNRAANLTGSQYSPNLSNGLVDRSEYKNSALNPQFYSSHLPANSNFLMGFPSDVSSKPLLFDSLLYGVRNGYLSEANGSCYSPNMVIPHYSEVSALRYQPPLRNTAPSRGRVGSCDTEASVIIQGSGINHGMKIQSCPSLGHNPRGFHQESGAKTQCLLPLLSKCGSLADVKGYIYELAKGQHGCRFLQRMFDEGSFRDVQIIFNELIEHVDELMMNPFANYLMQKLLEVCSEEQRTHILVRVTKEPGELVRISLNTHGTRVVQKLIETLKTRQQILMVISALEPGFLALIKDLNGNHVVQRCLQCFSSEDSKFIFVAAAKYCVDIATHQHGCCVFQRCISNSTGEHRENLVVQISANGLLLAQDAYGNYVVQFILDLNIPFVVSKLTTQFEGNYVHLSTQKFSSHVIEKCLLVCNNDVRSTIIHELLAARHFDQLLQDPHANYVVQTALRVSKGPVHNSLVDAIESYKAVSRNSPYSKRIFSHKLLRR